MKPLFLLVGAALACGAAAAPAADLTFSGYAALPDGTGQMAMFTIQFTAPPDFHTTAPGGQVRDGFALWIDPDAPVAYDRASAHYFGDLPDSSQTFISSDTIRRTGKLQASWVVDSTGYSGRTGEGGWGQVQGYIGYSEQADTLSFTVPLALLRDTDSVFYYSLTVTQYGSCEGDCVYNGVSGDVYNAPFPPPAVDEPSTAPLLAAGGLWLALKRRARPPATPPRYRAWPATDQRVAGGFIRRRGSPP